MPSARVKSCSEPTKLLTIAIPHFNDEAGLLSTIQFLAKEDLNGVEVIVSDNGSGISFTKTEPELFALINDLKVFKNRSNLGYDKNLNIAVSKSTGKFVWFLGCDDKPAKGCLPILMKTLNDNSDTTSLLLRVQTDRCKIGGGPDNTFTKISAGKIGTNIEDLYNSALSGNVVNRQHWLAATKKDLQFENWCHVERSLQMHANTASNPYSLRMSTASVIVKRHDRGWWNEDDGSFLRNVLLHREVIAYYHRMERLTNCTLPEFCESPSKTIIKAILYSRSIAQKAPPKIHRDNCKMIEQSLMHYAIYQTVKVIPKTIIRSTFNIIRSLKSLTAVRQKFCLF